MDITQGDDLRTHIEAFADKNELVLFISNTTDQDDKVTLDLSDMIGTKQVHAWASLVESNDANPLNNDAAAKITNFNVPLKNGKISNLDLGAFESVRISIALGKSGADVFGHDQADSLDGSAFSDAMDGRSGNDRLAGLAGNDTLVGGKGFDSLRGDDGNDHLYGGNGADRLIGGLGDDFIFGGNGSDSALFSGAQRVTVDLQLTSAQKTGHGMDVLTDVENIASGRGNDQLRGNDKANQLAANAGHDILDGRNGDDSLFGGNGNDTLTGGADDDALYGGSGRDHFVFNDLSGQDTVFDFTDGQDLIRFTDPETRYSSLTIQDGDSGVSIGHGLGDTIFLSGLVASLISAADFLFG